MTKRKVTEPPDPIDPDHQAALILAAFSQYLEQSSDRSIVLSRPDRGRGGWLVELNDRRSAHGNSLRDATAQIATALRLESDEASS